MNKRLYVFLMIGVVIVIGGGYALWLNQRPVPVQNQPEPPIVVVDPLNAAYLIDGASVLLVNGVASTTVGGVHVSTSVFGQPVLGDLNGDGVRDAALLMTQDKGGSGIFYYVAASVRTASSTQGTNALLLGDRIAPQNVEIRNAQIIANYADRKVGEPMTTPPSVGVSGYYAVDGAVLKKVMAPVTTITFVSSKKDATTYCNGVDMDSAGYQKTITVQQVTSTLEINPTSIQVIKETIHAATTGMCRTVLDQLAITEQNGIVTIPPIEGWAGSSIVMCSCKPIVETNVLRIPGMKQVLWK